MPENNDSLVRFTNIQKSYDGETLAEIKNIFLISIISEG